MINVIKRTVSNVVENIISLYEMKYETMEALVQVSIGGN